LTGVPAIGFWFAGGSDDIQTKTQAICKSLKMPYRQPGSEGFSLTAEQLEASRSERMRLNGHGTLTLEDARTWIEETGLCLFLPRRQFSSSVAPSFVEAVAGHRNPNPEPNHIALAEELLVRLETDGVAVRLNLLGQPGDHPDFVVAAWVLPYVYALRGDRDWRRSPQLTGSRQVSPLAVQAYKLLEAGETTIPSLKHTLGREVSEQAVLRAITELWQQLRIIPVIAAPGQTPKWQLLRVRYQKAIAEGASTSQVTAISVLASIFLQAVIAATMEDVELFLAPLTARSKVREVLRGLVATRQVHTISLGHAPHFYVAGTLPEFAVAPTIYASSSMPASAYFLHSHDREEEIMDRWGHSHATPVAHEPLKPAAAIEPEPAREHETHVPHHHSTEQHTTHQHSSHQPVAAQKSPSSPPRFSRPAAHARDRKPAQSSSAGRSARRPGAESSSRSSARPGARSAGGPRSGSSARWSANGSRSSNGNGRPGHSVARSTNGHHSNGTRTGKPSASAVSPRNGHDGKTAGKTSATSRSGSLLRKSSSARKDVRTNARSSRPARKPALTAGAKAGNSKRYGFTAPARPRTKKRG
jgi:23S rRNA pseudouridine2605 synthase